VDDAANDAVIDFFASLLKIARSRLRIVSGLRSRAKTLRIEGMHRGEFIEGLEPLARRECAGIER